MNTIASRDQFKPIRIEENLRLNYNCQYCSRTDAITPSSILFYSSFQRNPYLAFPYLFWNIFVVLYYFGIAIFSISIWSTVSLSVP